MISRKRLARHAGSRGTPRDNQPVRCNPIGGGECLYSHLVGYGRGSVSTLHVPDPRCLIIVRPTDDWSLLASLQGADSTAPKRVPAVSHRRRLAPY